MLLIPVVVVVVILVGLTQVGSQYYAIGRVWEGTSQRVRRRVLIELPITLVLGGLMVAVGIAAPFGSNTIAYEMCGLGGIVVVIALVVPIRLAMQNHREVHESASKSPVERGD